MEVFSVTPGGSDPETIENVYRPFPPVTVMVAEYDAPTVVLLAEQGPQSRFTAGAITTMVQISVSEFPLASVTLAVKV